MRLRHALLGASTALALLLTGCGGAPATPDEPSASAHASANPSSPVIVPTPGDAKGDPAGIPTGEALTEWADAALPVDTPGGSAPLLRETVALSPDLDEAEKELDLPTGAWALSIACIGDGTLSTDLDLGGEDFQDADLPCATPPDYTALPLQIDINGGQRMRLEVEADVPTGVVYQVVERTPQN